jgi:20S proteasome alpha/beta subunit
MTTIAWDGVTLAADKCSWSGPARRTVRKVFKIESPDRGPLLVGFCGHQTFALQVLAWMKGGERPNPSTFFERELLTQQCCVAIDSDRRVWALGNDLHWSQMEETIFALGAGHEFAWGALEAGASAVRAIEIAAKRSDYAGMGVDSVSFDP